MSRPSRRSVTQGFWATFSQLAILSASDNLSEKQAQNLLRRGLDVARLLVRALTLVTIAAVAILVVIALAHRPSVWLYRGFVVCIGLVGCALAWICAPLMLGLEAVRVRFPETQRILETPVRTTAAIACVAVVAASLCLFMPLNEKWGLPVLALLVLPTTALGILLGWVIIPTWIIEKLVLLPLALFLGVIAAMLFPRSANFLDAQYAQLDQRTEAWLFGKTVTSSLKRMNLCDYPSCEEIAFFDQFGTPLIYYWESPEGTIDAYSAPGKHPVHRAMLKAVEDAQIREKLVAQCKKECQPTPQPSPPTMDSPPEPSSSPPSAPILDMVIVCVLNEGVGQTSLDQKCSIGLADQFRKAGFRTGGIETLAGRLDEPTRREVGMDCGALSRHSQQTASYLLCAELTAEALGPDPQDPEHMYRWKIAFSARVLKTATAEEVCSDTWSLPKLHMQTTSALQRVALADVRTEGGKRLLQICREALPPAP